MLHHLDRIEEFDAAMDLVLADNQQPVNGMAGPMSRRAVVTTQGTPHYVSLLRTKSWADVGTAGCSSVGKAGGEDFLRSLPGSGNKPTAIRLSGEADIAIFADISTT
jgi:hypothetical protein